MNNSSNTITGSSENSSKITGFSDNPANEDQLGCGNYYDGLAQFIKSCPTPMTIAIQGDWGTGKSTAMRIVEKKIEGFGHTIEFNTWKFSKSSGKMLIVPLIDLLIKNLDKIGAGKPGYQKAFLGENNELKKILTRVGGLCFLAGQGVLERFTGAGNVISDVKNAVFSPDEKDDYIENADELHTGIQKRINYFKENDGKRIVIFVDDLDRLAPEDAVNLLEDMKNIMDFENCVFVLALDHKIVMQGLSKKYGNIDKAYADRYFDKIIQLPFYLPVNSYKINEFVHKMNDQGKILTEDEVAKVVNVLDRFDENNPRTIKRLMNLMMFYDNIGDTLLKEHRAECFTLNLLQLNHINYYEAIIESFHDFHEIDINKILNEDNYYQSYCKNYWVKLERLMEERQKEENDSRLSPHDVLNVVKDIVNDDCILLKKLIMATSVTVGNSVVERVRVVEETESLMNQFLKQYFNEKPSENDESPSENDESSRKKIIYKVCNDNNDEKGTITLSNWNDDHVNITVTRKGNGNISGLNDGNIEVLTSEIISYLKQMEMESIPINLKVNDTFSILCEKNTSVCLFNVSVKDNKSLVVAGKLLRNLSDKGVLFTSE